MTTLFPMLQPEAAEQEAALPLCRETAWDFKRNQPIWKNGNPVIVSGTEAVKVWCWKALMTERARYEIYSWDFGSEVESLIGQPYTDELKQAEAVRYVREALEPNPYVARVASVTVDFEKDGAMTISAAVDTVYGEVEV